MKNIVDFLPCGHENAIKMAELAVLLSCSQREVRALINAARREGAVICSTCDSTTGGFFLPSSVDEIKRYVAFQQHRISSAKEAVRSAKKFLKNGGFS
ncbi:MAG TPA: hypothetical protein PLH83_04145 [Ruminococcus sp.]|nr:hypothetical protein [Ruminococcus sp.]